MSAPRWFSQSKSDWKVLAEMHDMELLNSYRKLERGEYRESDGEPPDVETQLALRDAFIAEMGRRELDPQYKNGKPPVEGEQ